MRAPRLLPALAAAAAATPLDDYVARPDPLYEWRDTGGRLSGKGWDAYILNLTSQGWLTATDSDRSVWTHTLAVIVPSTVAHPGKGVLWITGGDNGDKPPGAADEDLSGAARLAVAAGTPAAVLYQVPNQPVTFALDPAAARREEGAIDAFLWDHVMAHPTDQEWLMYMPMVKAGMRAMDAAAEFLQSLGADAPARWAVGGASKRGWTAWLVAAVDRPRVDAVFPVVLDIVNTTAYLDHQWRAYGGWTYITYDYHALNVFGRVHEPAFRAITDVIDVAAYAPRLAGMPKLVVNAGNDEFELPDDDAAWWAAMPGPKHRLLLPNAEHSLLTGMRTFLRAAGAWLRAWSYGAAAPAPEWEVDRAAGVVTVRVPAGGPAPSHVVQWTAVTSRGSAGRRDFRAANWDGHGPSYPPCPVPVVAGVCANTGVRWRSEELVASGDGATYVARANATPHMWPATGAWAATFVSLRFPAAAGGADDFELTTQATVWPDTYPFPPCGDAASCNGTLV